MTATRSIRIFLSSTFRDFGEERDLLVKRVFPALRARLKDRFVELVDVDLRWGITVEEAERGEVLPICLAEIDRSRPYFIGMLGERYGWIPSHEGYAPDLLERQPWLKKHQGGKSVTELEILHGVLKNKRMRSRAFFYFRSPAYARSKGGHYVPDSTEDRQRQLDLKRRIKDSGYSVTGYRDPEALAKRMERDLWKLLDAEFPATDIPDAFERESMRHEAYAAPRRRLYLGGDTYIHALNALIKNNANRILITGQSGGGKSALLANALAKHHGSKTHLLEHYLGSSSDAADAVALVRRVIEYIRRVTGNTDPVAADTEELFDSVPTWLAIASAFAKKNRTRWIFVFDALNNLNGYRNLKWFPAYLPERIQIVVSCLEGEVKEALETKGTWDSLVVEPLDPKGQSQLLTEYLKRFNKSLPADLLSQALEHPLANNPLWLKTLAEELRLFGSHEELSYRMNTLLGPPKGKDENELPTVDDLFEHVLQRIEGDQGRKLVRDALTAIWASRAGLSEPELLEILAPHSVTTGKAKKANKLPPAQWAPVRNALDEMLLESGGRIIFGHDYVKVAVKDRYLPRESLQRNAHKRLAEHFAKRKIDERVAEELPHQWREAKAWRQLRLCLTKAEMFDAICDSRPEEHLQHWLKLENIFGGLLIEKSLKRAWNVWKISPDGLWKGALINKVVTFLIDSARGSKSQVVLKFAREARSINEKVLGGFHDETRKSILNLATIYSESLNYDQAQKLLQESMSITVRIDGPNSSLYSAHLNDLGSLQADVGLFDAAEINYRRSLEISEEVNGASSEATSVRLNNLALLLIDRGKYAEALSIATRALNIKRTISGEKHPDYATGLNTLGRVHSVIGELNKALIFYRKALVINEETRGHWHKYTATAMRNLASVLYEIGDFNEAEGLLNRSLDIVQEIQGDEHPDMVDSLNGLALFLFKSGDLEVSEAMFRRALGLAESIYDKSASNVIAMVLSNLALVLDEKGELEDAELINIRVLDIKKRIFGMGHPDTALTLNNLGMICYSRSDFESADRYLKQSLKIYTKALGLEHPSTGTSLNNLGLLLKDKGDYDGAELLYRRALAISEKAQGPDHPDTGTRLNNLGLLLSDKGDFEGAELLLRRALAISEKAQGPVHPSTGTSLNNLGLLLSDKGDYDGAELLYRRALAIAEKAQGPDHPDTGTRLNNLGLLLSDKGDYEGAELLYRRALAISEQAQGPEHPSTAISLNNLGSLLKDKGDYDGAELLYRRALAIIEKALGPGHPDTGTSLNNLGSLLKDKGDYDGAELLYRRALAISEKAQGPDHPDTGTRLNNLGLLLSDKGDFEGAELLLRRALAISEKAQGPDHPDTGSSLWSLGNVLVELSRLDEGIDLIYRELNITKKNDGESSHSAAGTHRRLGVILRGAGRYKESRLEFQKALEIFESLHKRKSDEVAGVLNGLGQLEALEGNFSLAQKLFAEALEIRREVSPDNVEDIEKRLKAAREGKSI